MRLYVIFDECFFDSIRSTASFDSPNGATYVELPFFTLSLSIIPRLDETRIKKNDKSDAIFKSAQNYPDAGDLDISSDLSDVYNESDNNISSLTTFLTNTNTATQAK